MKKIVKISALIMSVSFLFFGCKEKTDSNSTSKTETVTVKDLPAFEVENKTSLNYSEITDFFTPDYESVLIADNEQSSTATETSKASNAGKTKSENIIPGLRKLSDYKISYSNKKAALIPAGTYENQVSEMNSEIEAADKQSFKINSWGPQNAIVSQNENPTFYVVFSQPVHKIMALEEPSDVSDIMTISPKIKGTFRWYGSKMLAYEASEPANPAQSYEISVKPGIKALSGAKLSGLTSFSTKAEEVKYVRVWAGYIKDSEYESGLWSGGLKPPLDKRYYVRLNYPVSKEIAQDSINIEIDGKKRSFEVEPDFDATHFRWYGTELKCDKAANITNSWIVTLNGTVPFGTKVEFLEKDNKSFSSYNTLEPFYIRNVDKSTSDSTSKRKNPLRLYFSQNIDAKTLYGNINFDFDCHFTEDNFKVEGQDLYIYNLPIKKGETHKIILKDGIKDIYGQPIDFRQYRNDQPLYTKQNIFTFEVSSPSPFTHFIDSGNKIMEAQYPHKLVFEYMNIDNGKYRVATTTNPIDWNFKENFLDVNAVELNPGEKDYNYFEEIDLNPYLNDGYGAVKFQAYIEHPEYSSWSRTWNTRKAKNAMTVQVTDLGVTARVGINRAVVLVTSIQTGKPIENATVELYGKVGNKAEDIDSTPYAKGKTDKNGLAVIDYTEEEYNRFRTYVNYLDWNASIVKVTNGSDKVLYQPSSHYCYGYGVDRESYKKAISDKQRTFMFVDRGLYRPGETITFRGIDRTQKLGQLLVQRGGYKVEIYENVWDGKRVGEALRGSLSDSGGFYGSFELPKDLEPGRYVLRYTRDTPPASFDRWGDVPNGEAYFTVAEFERLKFEAAVTIPQMTYYGGDSISAVVNANYLAGGALDGAEYETNWFRQYVEFKTDIPEAKGYSFGPRLSSESRSQYSADKGKLNTEGKANLSSKTEKILTGSPMLYRAFADITDLSNQRVSVNNSVMVHSSNFYVGLKRTGNGFAEKGKKLDVSYLIVNPEGQLVAADVNQKVTKLEYKLTHKEWKYVNENSVNNSVYTRYVCEEVEDGKGTIDVKADKGTFTVVPEAAGWYTLTVTGVDNKGNYVESVLNFYATGSGYSWWKDDSEGINLTTSQNMYNPGDKAQLLMESPLPAGDYLITVEREGIFTQEVRHIDAPATVLEIPVSKNYVPVVYVSVASYSVRNGDPTHQFGQVDLDKPKGYYGCVPLFVNPKVKAFSVKIETDKPTYRPGEEVEVTLTATKGGAPFKNAELTLMAVDRGVLDLINYHVANPIDFFYDSEKYPLAVFGGDTRALIMDPVTYSVKNLAGGDAEETDEEKEQKRKDFRPTAVFEPVVMTDSDGKAVVRFTMPDNLTTYRITCFGVSNDLFALNESEVKVQNPVNVSVVQPRKLRERDTAEMGVLLTNLDKDAHKIKVMIDARPASAELNSEDEDGFNIVPGNVFIDGENEHEVTVGSNQSSVVYFDVGAISEGTAIVTFKISSDILNESIEVPLEVVRTYVYETVATSGSLDETEAKGSEQIVIPGFAKNGRGDVSVTLDATRLGLLGNGVNYLFEYPYGCLEQQTSRLLPLVLFGEYIDVFGLDSKVKNPKKVVRSLMKEIAKAQKPDGGFPYWPNGSISNYYVSLRLAQIYQAAIENGYTKADLAINYEALLNYIDYNMNGGYYRSYMAQACYVLAKAGRSSVDMYLTGLLNTAADRSFKEICYTGLACLERGDKKGVETCSKLLRQYILPTNRAVSITQKDVKNSYYMWTNNTNDMALMLKFFVEENEDDDLIEKFIYSLMMNQTHGYWMNTYTTASVLDAIGTYIKNYNLDNTDYRGTAVFDSKEIMSESFKGAGAKPKTLELPFEGEILASLPRDKALELSFNKKGNGHLFYTVTMTYALPDELQAARDEGLKITYEIRDYETDEIINKEDASTNELMLESGKLYKAKITVQTNRNREYVALRAPIASGAEILDSTFVTTGFQGDITSESSTRWGHTLSNKVIYDNEIHFFWDYFDAGSATVNYTFRATRRGVYPVPPVQAECMYEPEVFGRSFGYLTEIK